MSLPFLIFILYLFRKEKIMSKSLIQVTNQSPQDVAVEGIINLGAVQRRFGCDCRLSGNAIEVDGQGYFEIDAAVSIAPTATGAVTVAVYKNGVQIPGAIAYGSVSTANNPVTLCMNATVRRGCCCEGADNLTLVLEEGAGTVNNVSMRVVKA
jgi:hypothetical protein